MATLSHAISAPDATILAGVLFFLLALLFLVDSTPRAYWLRAGNADLTISTCDGTFPMLDIKRIRHPRFLLAFPPQQVTAEETIRPD